MAKRPIEAVILAAGRGSRLSEETNETPKALLPIGPRSKRDATQTSFLLRHVELLRALDVEKITVVIGYKREVVAREIEAKAPYVDLVVNPTPEIQTSGSLHSFQFAMRSPLGLLDGTRQTVLMDADIVYPRDALAHLLDAPAKTTVLVCDDVERNDEEVCVFGSEDAPHFLGKALPDELVGGLPCLGEATGIVKFAPAEHALVRKITDWMLGDPTAKEGSPRWKGFGPAKRATEHEELTQRLMLLHRARALVFDGQHWPFMECDSPAEYRYLREELYPRIVEIDG